MPAETRPPRKRPEKSRPTRRLWTLAALLVAVFATLFAGTMTSDATWSPRLALDLEGGTQIILTPRTDDGSEITDEDVDQAISIIRNRVDASGVSEAEISSQGGQNIVVGLPGNPSEETLDLVRRSAQLDFRPVLDMLGPGAIDPEQLEAQSQGEAPTDGEADPLPEEVPTDGEDADVVEPPEDEVDLTGEVPTGWELDPDLDVSQDIIDAAARAADGDSDGEITDEPAQPPQNSSDPSWVTEQVLFDVYTLDCTLAENRVGGFSAPEDEATVACDDSGEIKFILGPAAVDGSNLTSASSGMQTNQQGMTTGQYAVMLDMDSEGADAFGEISQRLITQPTPQDQFAISLDGLVISSAGFQEPILDGSAQITGDYTQDEAEALANQLAFGALPITFEVQSEEQISATLGSEQLQRGLLAGVIGLGLVVAYMMWQYRGIGLLSVASLLVAATVTYLVIALLSWTINYRLSLPGVAGLILAVGVTADSFIVYFERVRDEIRAGRSLNDAITVGWERARRTILASDTVNFLAAIVLYLLAVGGVRGFAFTLGLTTLVDLVVVFLFTHPMMRLLVRTRFFGGGHRLSGMDPVRLGGTPATYQGRGRRRDRRDDDKRGRRGEAASSGSESSGGTATATMTIAERKAAQRRADEEAGEG